MKKIIILLLISVFLISGCSIKKESDVTDAEIFSAKYDVPKNNSFKYLNIEEVFELFESGSGIILFGNSDQEYSNFIVKMFNNLINENDIKEVFYYNPNIIKENDTDNYEILLDLLSDNLPKNSDGDEYLEIPSVYFIKDGEIIGYYASILDLEKIDEDDELKEENKLKEFYQELITKFKKNIDEKGE